jgi:hypothetical protein
MTETTVQTLPLSVARVDELHDKRILHTSACMGPGIELGPTVQQATKMSHKPLIGAIELTVLMRRKATVQSVN